ncbi:MAG TPA: chemotaxis protein CheA [Gemmatimonadales bacterium]|nr:chemotaxis protein CheA [Gemmatimonadales bacterium]
MADPKYAALFLAESREHLRACNQLLLAWERDAAASEPVNGLFRAIHNIKGMAATMGYSAVADLAHRAESLLETVRGGRAATPELIQLLFRSVDALEKAIEGAAAGKDEPPAGLLAALDRVASAGAPAPTAPGASAATPPVARAAGVRKGPVGHLVGVTIRGAAPMRGARALLALQRAETLGRVTALRPAAAAFEREDFDGRFSFHLRTDAPKEQIEAAVRSAGEVAAVAFDGNVVIEAEGPAVAARQIRVDLHRLDAMMKQVGELVVARNRLVERVRGDDSEVSELAAVISRLVSDLQSEIVEMRMTPVSEVFDRFPRLVRDLARDLGKQIRFEVEGGDIELDRAILDELGDPLLHLIRNAADHGLEAAAEREAVGKPAEGRILLSATRERRSVAIRVSDDGRGIDRAAILAKAKREGLADAGVATLTDDVLLRVLARPGFTTAAQVSGVSGRGVGVEVALGRARALGGSLDVQTEPGRGTTFTLRVPLTLAIVRALLAQAGEERYAVPLVYVAETVEFDARAVTALRSREALVVRDRVIPTVHLRDLVAARAGREPARRPTIILEVGERRTALVVDALLGQQDIVIEPFDAPRGMPPYLGGATILADGAPALILDAAALV